MAQPPAYAPTYDFSDYQASRPAEPLPAGPLDTELARVQATLDAVLRNLAQIQRDDGQIANNSIGVEQLKAALQVGINVVSEWTDQANYGVLDAVWHDSALWLCGAVHTSISTLTPREDTAHEFWVLIVDFLPYSILSDETIGAAAAAQDAAVTAEINAGFALESSSDAAVSAAAALASQIAAAASEALVDLPDPTGNAGQVLFVDASGDWAILGGFTYVDGILKLSSGASGQLVLLKTGMNASSYAALTATSDTEAKLDAANGAAGVSQLSVSPRVSDGTSAASVDLMRYTNTSGVRALNICRGDGTTTVDHALAAGATSSSGIGRNGGKLAVGKAGATVTLDCGGTDGLRVPVGSTAQRPASPSGCIRYNTTTAHFEGHNGTAWVNLDV